MALVNLNNNNNVMQRDKDKENERTDITKTKTFMISGGPTKKFEQKSENHKNKKDKVRRNKNGSNNNINIVRNDFVATSAAKTTDSNKNQRISTGTMTSNAKPHNKNMNSRFQYEPNQMYSLGMQMNQNRLSPPHHSNNVSPCKTDSSSSSGSRMYDSYSRNPINIYPHHHQNHWQHHNDRYAFQQPLQNENNWHHYPSYNNNNNWTPNNPPYNSFNNRLSKTWKSHNYLNQSTRSNSKHYNDVSRLGGGDGPQINPSAKRNTSVSPSLLKSETPLSKSSSKSSLNNDRSSRSSVNSSPDNHSSELEYDSDTPKNSYKGNKGKNVANKRQSNNKFLYESRSAPEMSTLSDYAASYRSSMPVDNNYTNGRNGFYQQQQQQQPPQQQQQGYFGSSPQCLQINNWVSNLGGNVKTGPPGFQMYAPDTYDAFNNNGDFFANTGDGQKNKQRSLSKESLNSGICSDTNSMQTTETNNNYMFYLNPNTFPQQFQSTNRSKHVMNHVHRFNPSPNSKTKPNKTPTTASPDTFFYNSLSFVKEEPKELLCGSIWDPISKDIWTKFLSAQQSEPMYNKKIQLWRYLYHNIKQNFPQYGLYMVGSTIAGFGTDGSDVDMCLVSREQQVNIDPRTNAMVTLSQIQKFLQAYPAFDEFHLIQARVPILRFKDVENKIEVDLNYNNCVGIRNTHLLHCYAQMDWRLRPLVLIVKLWAQFHNINDARNATLPSYSLVLMVIHFLQCGVQPAVLPCLHKLHLDKFAISRDYTQINMNEVLEPVKSENHDTLGELFVKFLEYYSMFDYTQNAISIRTASCLPIEQCRQVRTPKNDTHQWKVLCIEEPFEFTNTARSVYDPEVFERVKTTFLTSWQLLKKSNRLDSVFSMPLFTPVHLYSPPPPMPNYPLIFSPIPSPNRTNIAIGDTKANNH